jgi:hypothetical protein
VLADSLPKVILLGISGKLVLNNRSTWRFMLGAFFLLA